MKGMQGKQNKFNIEYKAHRKQTKYASEVREVSFLKQSNSENIGEETFYY